MRVRALVAHHAHAADIGQHGERLPDLAFETCRLDLLAHDRIGVLEDLDLLARDVADDAHAETRTGERLTPHDLVGQTELAAHGANLVLEQRAEWLDELEVHVVGQAAHVVVRLDLRGLARTRFDHVGIQRALHEERRVLDAARGVLEDPDEQLSDDLALALGIGHTGQRLEEPVSRVHVHEFDFLVSAEGLDDLLAFALAHEPGVDEDTRELRPDRLVHERGSDC